MNNWEAMEVNWGIVNETSTSSGKNGGRLEGIYHRWDSYCQNENFSCFSLSELTLFKIENYTYQTKYTYFY